MAHSRQNPFEFILYKTEYIDYCEVLLIISSLLFIVQIRLEKYCDFKTDLQPLLVSLFPSPLASTPPLPVAKIYLFGSSTRHLITLTMPTLGG